MQSENPPETHENAICMKYYNSHRYFLLCSYWSTIVVAGQEAELTSRRAQERREDAKGNQSKNILIILMYQNLLPYYSHIGAIRFKFTLA